MKRCVSVLTFLFLISLVSAEIIPQDPTPQNAPSSRNTEANVGVTGYFPQWSRLGLQSDGSLNWITVTGCGFLGHSEVTCIFDFTFTSTYARIVDDGTIECELPTLELTDFMTLPQYTRLDLIFEGDLEVYSVYVGQFRWGPELETDALSATRGPSSGGPAIDILGQGFADPVLNALTLNVYFDGQLAQSASVTSDTTISVVPPAVDELGVDALVSILWQGVYDDHGPIEVYLHSPVFFHYGPLFDSITPPCAWVNTSRAMTINGVGFNDPLFVNTVTSPDTGASARTNVMLEVSISPNPTPNWDDSTYHTTGSAPTVLQAFSTSVSDTTVVFNSPNFLQGVINPTNIELGDFYGVVATVDVLWRQTRRLTSSDNALTYRYGPIFEELDTEVWYYGGGDIVCLLGCGFLDPNVEAAISQSDALGIFVGGNALWNTGVAPSVDDDAVCYPILADVACGDLTVTARLVNNPFFQNAALNGAGVSLGGYSAGPQLNAFFTNNAVQIPVRGGNVVLTGNHFGYSFSNNNDENAWSTITLTTNSESGESTNLIDTAQDLLGSHSVDIDLTSFSDESLTLTWGVGTFGELFDLTISFDGACSIGAEVYMGPSCDSEAWFYSTLSGGTTISITGTGFADYTTAVKLCDQGAEINKPPITPAGGITTFGSSFPVCWEQEIASEAVGTVEFYSETSGGATISFTTSELFTAADVFRGSRNWGQLFDVVVMFNSVQDDTFRDAVPSISSRSSWDVTYNSCVDYDGSRHSGTDGVTSCSSYAALHCGTLRFGPVVDAFTPCQGPVGPINSFITPVTFTGSFFDDSWSGVARDINPHLVSFGNLFGQPITNPSSTSMSTSTVWGGHSLADLSGRNSISLFFDTCNITQVPDLKIHWGPWFDECAMHPSFSDFPYPGTCDFYGAIPVEANLSTALIDTINIRGHNLVEWEDEITCLIDGVESDDTTVNIDSGSLIGNVTCNVPRRPFGTRAKICLAFGSWRDQNGQHASPDSEWSGANYRAIGRVICLDEVLVFAPALVATTGELYAGHTSGLTNANVQETFEIDCYGCDNYWLSDFGPTFLVGSYATTADWESGSPDHGFGTLIFDVPTFVAEFNTDVSIAIEWFQPYINIYPEFFKIWAEQTYHYGPLCDGSVTPSNVVLYGTDDGLSDGNPLTITLGGQFFRDCPSVTLCQNDTLNGLCEIPQPSDRAQHPFTLNGEGNRRCLHRAVEITMVGSPDSYDNVEEESDTEDPANSDSSLSVILPVRDDIDCASYTFELYFPDALVTSAAQRTIVCEGTLTYGPGRPVLSGFYSYTTDADVLGLDTIYGWGGPRQTVSVNNDDTFVNANYDDSDPYWGGSTRLDMFFGSPNNVVQGDTFDGDTDYDVPADDWGAFVQLSTAYFDGSEYKCRFDNAMFHYGSEILYSDRDECSSADVVCTNQANPGDAVISGRALGCCGFSSSNTPSDTAEFQHRCAWSGSGASFWDDTIYRPTALDICTASCSDLETVTCRIPEAEMDEAAAYRLVGFGLLLGSGTDFDDGTLLTSTACPGSICSLPEQFGPYNQFDNDALLADGNRMQVCYGPKVYTSTDHTRLSGYAPRSGPSLLNPDTIQLFDIIVAGECNTAQVKTVGSVSGVFLECNYDGDDGTETTYATAKWECPARFMAKLCGATDDTLTVTFVNLTSPVSGFTYAYTPAEYLPTGSEDGDWFLENGPDVIASTISYGPFVPVDGYFGTTANSASWVPRLVDNFTLPVPVNPDFDNVNPSLTVEINYADDWIGPISTQTAASAPISMWGTEKAACFFGTLDNTNPAYLLGLGNPDNQNDVASIGDLTYSASNVQTITCPIPPGQFGAEGNVYVLLDPHTDEWTQFYNWGDSQYSDARAGDWHWSPYISEASSEWTAPEGLEPVTFYGYGFADYVSVICQFGTELAVQGDIVSDSIVICLTPPYAAPATVDVTLTFGMASDSTYSDEGCGYYSDTDIFNSCSDLITATYSSYSFTGVVSHNPRHGPIQGNTTIYFQQVGFDFYDSIDCVFHLVSGDSTVVAAPVADLTGDYFCVSPSVDAAQEIQITLIGHYSTFENTTVYSTNLGCVWFAYGTPIITSISPDSVVFGSDVTQVTLRGWYFNGGLSAASYQCVWQHGPIPESDLPLELGAQPTFNSDVVYTTQATLVSTTNTRDGLVFDTFDVVCPTPAGGFPQAGQYPFQLVFSDLPTDNTFNFAVTYQTVTLTSVSPNTLRDFNATAILTITGSGFAGGRQTSDVHSNSYLCRTTLQNGFVAISPADFISDTEIQCYAAIANLTAEYNQYVRDNRRQCTGKNANRNCNPTFDFPLDVSIDGGYTWTTQSLTISYSHQKLCKNPASLLSPSLFSLLFVPFFFLVAYFF